MMARGIITTPIAINALAHSATVFQPAALKVRFPAYKAPEPDVLDTAFDQSHCIGIVLLLQPYHESYLRCANHTVYTWR